MTTSLDPPIRPPRVELEREEYLRIASLVDQLNTLDGEVQAQLDKVEETLRTLNLKIPIGFGTYFVWAKKAGRWALWVPNAEHPTAANSVPRIYRAQFLEWLADDLGTHVIAALEDEVRRRKAVLGIERETGADLTPGGDGRCQLCVSLGIRSAPECTHPDHPRPCHYHLASCLGAPGREA